MKAKIKKKNWGYTRPVFGGDSHSMYHASIEPGGYSSRHYHGKQHNLFYVVSGDLLVHFYADATGPVTRSVQLARGDSVMAESGEWHSFEAITAVELIELYAAFALECDIVRADEGGIKTRETQPR